MTRFLVATILISILSAGCASTKSFKGDRSTTTANSVLEIIPLWVKDKGKKYDIEMNVRNVSDQDIILFLKDMSCQKGDAIGMLKHTFFNTGERVIDFRKGQMKRFTMVCDIGTKESGDYSIHIAKIYDNPESDGETKGKVIATEIVWTGKNK